MNSINPRYLAYCLAHRRTPEQMSAHDEQAYPGGCMCGFILWHSAKLNEARQTHCEFFYIEMSGTVGGLLDHEGYDKWLNASIAQDLQLIKELEESIGHPICGYVFSDKDAGQLICTRVPNHGKDHNA